MRFDEIVFARRSAILTAGVAAPFLLCAATAATGRGVPDASVAVALVLVIVAAAATGLRSAGMGAAASAAVWFDFFLTEPYDSFAIRSAEDVQVAVLLLLVGLGVTELALWGQRQRALLGRERAYLDGVVATAEAVAGGRRDGHDVVASVSSRIRELLEADRCEFHRTDSLPGLPVLVRDGSLVRSGRALPVDRSGLPVDEELVVPVVLDGAVLGYFRVSAATRVARPSPQQRRLAVVLADQLAPALRPPAPAP